MKKYLTAKNVTTVIAIITVILESELIELSALQVKIIYIIVGILAVFGYNINDTFKKAIEKVKKKVDSPNIENKDDIEVKPLDPISNTKEEIKPREEPKTPLKIGNPLNKFVLPVKFSIELTGSTKPYYNSYLSPSYFKAIKKQHYGCDLTRGPYTAIGDGIVESVSKTVGGGIVIRHNFDNDHDMFAIYWHGIPKFKRGSKVNEFDYITDSTKPYSIKEEKYRFSYYYGKDKIVKYMGKHTHFELRIVPKGHKWNYYDVNRAKQCIDPLLLKPRNPNIKIGQKIQNYLKYKKYDIM